MYIGRNLGKHSACGAITRFTEIVGGRSVSVLLRRSEDSEFVLKFFVLNLSSDKTKESGKRVRKFVKVQHRDLGLIDFIKYV